MLPICLILNTFPFRLKRTKDVFRSTQNEPPLISTFTIFARLVLPPNLNLITHSGKSFENIFDSTLCTTSQSAKFCGHQIPLYVVENLRLRYSDLGLAHYASCSFGYRVSENAESNVRSFLASSCCCMCGLLIPHTNLSLSMA